jgi:hypothetical protein
MYPVNLECINSENKNVGTPCISIDIENKLIQDHSYFLYVPITL